MISCCFYQHYFHIQYNHCSKILKSFFSIFFSWVCIKMSKTLSGKYYQENKDCKRYQNLSKEEKEKKVAIWSWMLQKSLRGWKTKNLVRTQKYIIEWEKSNNLEILKVYIKIDNIFILKTIYFILQNMFRSLHTSFIVSCTHY